MPRGRKPTTAADTVQAPVETVKFLRRDQVVERTGLSYMTIWRLIKAGEFPPGRQASKKAVAWVSSEITDWIKSRPVCGTDC